MSTETDWRWADASGQQRLVRTDELRAALASGLIAPNTPVWRRGWTEWKPAYDVPELTTSALTAAHGLVPNIPPPPLAVVAVQHQFEGEPVAVRNKMDPEPPPPPSYVPAPARSAFGGTMQLHPLSSPRPAHVPPVRVPPAHPMQAVMSTSAYEGPPGAYRPPPGSQTDLGQPPIADVSGDANTAVNLTVPGQAAIASARERSSSGGSARTVIGVPQLDGEDRVSRTSEPSYPGQFPSSAPIAIPTISLQTLAGTPPPPTSSRPSSPPVVPVPPKSVPRASSKPPPAKPVEKGATLVMSPSKSGPPPKPSAPPPLMRAGAAKSAPGKPAGPVSSRSGARPPAKKNEELEELSGSILLPDQSGGIEELSGSVLLADASGPARPPAPSAEELSGSFLLDAGSTGTLPNVDSSGAMRAAAARVTEPSDVPAALAATTKSAPAYAPASSAASAASASSWSANAHVHPHEAAHEHPSAQLESPTLPVSMGVGSTGVGSTGVGSSGVGSSGMNGVPSSGNARASAPSPHSGERVSKTGTYISSAIPPPNPDVLAALKTIESTAPAPHADPGPGGHDRPTPTPIDPSTALAAAPPRTSAASSAAPNATLMGVAPPAIASEPTLSSADAPSTSRSPSQRPGFGPGPYSDSAAPAPERSSARLHDMSSLRPDPRKKFLLPAFAALGVLVGIGVIGLIIGAVRKRPSELESTAASSTTTSSATPLPPPVATHEQPASAPATTAANPSAPPAIAPACAPAGNAHVIAPRAVVQSGVEVQQLGPARVALGFASGPRDGMAVAVDPSSLVATQTIHARAPEAIRRVMPYTAGRGLAAASDTDSRRDNLQGRRTVTGDPPFDLGGAFGALAWAPFRTDKITSIWPLDGEGAVEALRAAPLDASNKDAGWALTFRRGATIYAGAVTGGKSIEAKGPLVKINGLGTQVGSPSVSASGGVIFVAWADRASSTDPWGLRWMRFAPGDASADANAFVPAEGGLGEQAMSPAIAAAGPNRFLLVWTEGAVANHQVRAQTVSASGQAVGAPLAISGEGVNAGQAQVAILPDGRGVVAYLAAREPSGKTYEVMATPVACP